MSTKVQATLAWSSGTASVYTTIKSQNSPFSEIFCMFSPLFSNKLKVKVQWGLKIWDHIENYLLYHAEEQTQDDPSYSVSTLPMHISNECNLGTLVKTLDVSYLGRHTRLLLWHR